MTKRNLFDELKSSLEELRDHPENLKRYEIEPVDIKQIRAALGMTQEQFAMCLVVPIKTIQKWEQGLRKPDGAANTLLRVMRKEPEAVMRALHA